MGEKVKRVPNPKHTHKYIRINGKFTWVWKCADPDCKHFVYAAQEYIVAGRASLCWECGKKFPMDEDALKEDMPKCFQCRNSDEVDVIEMMMKKAGLKQGSYIAETDEDEPTSE